MEVILYTTHCPRCNVLKAKLDKKRISYNENNSVDEMLALGIQSAPALKVDKDLMDFSSAIKWVDSQEVRN